MENAVPNAGSLEDRMTAAAATGKNEEDALLEEFDEIFDQHREKRLQQMKDEMAAISRLKHDSHGQYTEIEEREFLPLTTKTKRVVVHFYHPDFRRCALLDSHLEKLARVHMKTRFVKINAEQAPFFAQKLGIRMLPCLLVSLAGQVIDRMVGFDDLGGTDKFSTEALERRLVLAGVVKPRLSAASAPAGAGAGTRHITGLLGRAASAADDSDDSGDDSD